MTAGAPPIKWVLLDETGGAPCQNGETLTPEALSAIAKAMSVQLARDYGCDSSARAGSSLADIQDGECVYTFRDTLPEAPDAIAYHSVTGAGVPFAAEAIANCSSLFGASGAGMAASHEALETERNRGCNRWRDDGAGELHAEEICDAVEVQGYPIAVGGTDVTVANFLLESWFTVGAPGPYTFMVAEGLGGLDPPGPFQIAPASGGDYDTVMTSPGTESQVFAKRAVGGIRTVGTPRRPERHAHWCSRSARIRARASQRAGAGAS